MGVASVTLLEQILQTSIQPADDWRQNQETNPESKSYFKNRWVSWWGGVVVIAVSGGVVFVFVVFVVVDAVQGCVKRNAGKHGGAGASPWSAALLRTAV